MTRYIRYLSGDDALFTGAGSNAKARIKAVLGTLWLRRLARQMTGAAAAGAAVKFVGSENLKNHLPPMLADSPDWISIDDHIVAALEGLDHRVVAEFCDRLYASPGAAPYAGFSLLEIAELRWLHVATHEYANRLALQSINREYGPAEWRADPWSPDGARHTSLFNPQAPNLWQRQLTRLGDWRIRSAQLRMYDRLGEAYGFSARASATSPLMPVAQPRRAGNRLLVVAYYDRTMMRLLQAVPHLRGDLKINVHVICALRDIRLAEALRQAGCDVSYMTDWIDAGQWQQARREAAVAGQRAAAWLRQDGQAMLGDITAAGLPLLDTLRPYLEAAYTAALPDAAGAVLAASAAIAAIQPGCVLNFEDFELNRAVTLAARRQSIATLAYYTLSPTWRSDGMVRRSQNHVAVAGEQLAEVFRPQYGRNLRIVGDTLKSPLGDALQRREFRARMRQSLALGADEKLVLLLASYPKLGRSTSALREVFQRTDRIVRKIGAARLLVKAHPRQDVGQLRRWMEEWGVSGEIVRDTALHELCCAADLVSTTVSSSVVQALLAQVPVICLVPSRVLALYETRGNHYIGGGGIRCIGEQEDEVAVAAELLSNPQAIAEQSRRGLAHAEFYIGPLQADPVRELGAYINDLMPLRKITLATAS